MILIYGEIRVRAEMLAEIAPIASTFVAEVHKEAGSLSVDALLANGFDPDEFANTQRILDSEGETAATDSVTPKMLELGIAGSASDVITSVTELISMGVHHISFGPPLGTDRATTTHLIGTRVLPELRRAFR